MISRIILPQIRKSLVGRLRKCERDRKKIRHDIKITDYEHDIWIFKKDNSKSIVAVLLSIKLVFLYFSGRIHRNHFIINIYLSLFIVDIAFSRRFLPFHICQATTKKILLIFHFSFTNVFHITTRLHQIFIRMYFEFNYFCRQTTSDLHQRIQNRLWLITIDFTK